MKKHAVLSALGHDRVGVADDLAVELANRRIDIKDSRMTALGGEAALILHVSGEQHNVAILKDDLANLGADLGFHLQLKPIERKPPAGKAAQYWIESFSRGPAGIQAVTGVLKRHDVNIEDLESDASAASWTSAVNFYMKARITVPPSCPIDRLREEMRELERDRHIDVVIKPVSPPVGGGRSGQKSSPELAPSR